MIKFLPEIYPDEAVYSYLSRCYARSGYIWNKGFAKEIFERPTANIDCSLLNVLTPEFKEIIGNKIGLKELILNHTLFKYYARFLPLEKRKRVFEKALSNEPFLSQHLPIPLHTDTSCLRYCPECVKEDRIKYREAYIHITHTIPDINVCSKHNCELINVEFIKNKINNTAFIPLEFAISNMTTTILDKENINVKIAKYIVNSFHEPLNIKKELMIGNFLSNKLQERYISPRGEQRYIELLLEDIKEFYLGTYKFDITKNRLAYIYRNLSYNPHDILLIAMFQEIPPSILCSYKGNSKPKHTIFDQKVRAMHKDGLSMHKISKILNVNHEVVRQILLGTYDKPNHICSTYRCKKWDWDKIDDDCCRDFYNKIMALDKDHISKNAVAELFGLKDKTLRNLPRLKALIREYKAQLV